MEVVVTPQDRAAGRDPQLDRAIEIAMARLDEHRPPARPPDLAGRPSVARPALPGRPGGEIGTTSRERLTAVRTRRITAALLIVGAVAVTGAGCGRGTEPGRLRRDRRRRGSIPLATVQPAITSVLTTARAGSTV
ncbi:hypothetical protein [Pseudonocardia sp. ICBG601]|uniref:hypothetical protein n=1 Tax=Pseudonocardia sp. ICBG601 TaxID=2846759 RepID=UPI001CF64C5F|nr:hypothetical protein [Pseudonocardia sp. ICBG601]